MSHDPLEVFTEVLHRMKPSISKARIRQRLFERIDEFVRATKRLPTSEEVFAMWCNMARMIIVKFQWSDMPGDLPFRCLQFKQRVRRLLKYQTKQRVDNRQ